MAFPSTQLGISAGRPALQLPAVRNLPPDVVRAAQAGITIPSSQD
jgi:hypothetical protein